MTKFKRFAAIGLAAVMSIAAFAGCGTSSSSSSGSGDSDKKTEANNPNDGDGETKAPEASKNDYSDVGEGEGKVLNIMFGMKSSRRGLKSFIPDTRRLTEQQVRLAT